MTLTRDEFVSADPEQVRIALSRAYAEDLTVTPAAGDPFLFRRTTASDDTVAVSSVRISGRVTATMRGSRDVLFTDVTEGRYGWRSRGERGDQELPLILPSGHELFVDLDTMTSTVVAVDPRTVRRYFATFGGETPSPTLLNRAFSGSEAVRGALGLYASVMRSESFESALVRANLLEVLLAVTARHLMGDGPPNSGWTAPAALRRAEEYLREHAREPVSVADAAAAAGLSVRGLQDQFRKWRRLTPVQYLRSVRLAGSRSELVRARADGRPERIADVARRWGFAHLGRYSRYYGEAFGEAPSETLRDPRE